MKTLTRHLLSTRALAVAGVTALLAAATPAHAVLLTASQNLPNLSGNSNLEDESSVGSNRISLYTGNTTSTNGSPTNPSVNQVDLGVFTFTGYNASDLTSLVGLQITMELGQFNTDATDSNGNFTTQSGTFTNYEYLTIDGVNTGIQLNGFANTDDAETVTGISDPTAAATILSFLNGTTQYTSSTLVYSTDSSGNFTSANVENNSSQTNYSGNSRVTSNPTFSNFTASAGQLVVGVLNTAPSTNLSQQNVNVNTKQSPDAFFLDGGTASLAIADYIIPFHPAQALGLVLIALGVALWYLPATRVQFRRLLVPAA